jgi:sulfite reductase (NADPH) hemoprotein beta-component
VIGPSFRAADMPDVVETLIEHVPGAAARRRALRGHGQRLGIAPFKQRVYAEEVRRAA